MTTTVSKVPNKRTCTLTNFQKRPFEAKRGHKKSFVANFKMSFQVNQGHLRGHLRQFWRSI